jgi:hypothetical protein
MLSIVLWIHKCACWDDQLAAKGILNIPTIIIIYEVEYMCFNDPISIDLQEGEQYREGLEVTKVVRVNWSGVLLQGVLIVLALTAAACSGQVPNEAALMDSEVVTRSITVYESPT